MNYEEILHQIIDLAKRTGLFQKENLLRTDLQIDTKSTGIDLVTEIDKRSDEMITSFLKANFPEHSLLAEESGTHDMKSDFTWVIDPLDGTTNFSQGLPIFAVSIALQYRGQTMLGVVYSPVIDDLFYAIRGKGAYRNGNRMKVSSKEVLYDAVLATGFPYDIAKHPVNNLAYFNSLAPKTRAIRRFGAASYDLALVAAGKFDGYWEMALSPWDISAAALMVEEAGGTIIYFRNDRKISVIAGNETMCGLIHEEIKKVDSENG
jgi:myo-inositol-1(or 4)-monophosphatase